LQHGGLFRYELLDFRLLLTEGLGVKVDLIEAIHGHLPLIECLDAYTGGFCLIEVEVCFRADLEVEFVDQGLVYVLLVVSLQLLQELLRVIQ
jgi:hypothetical protein